MFVGNVNNYVFMIIVFMHLNNVTMILIKVLNFRNFYNIITHEQNKMEYFKHFLAN